MDPKAAFGERPDEAQWTELMSAVHPGNEFLTPDWFAAWEHAFLGSGSWRGEITHLVARDGATLLGVLPLCAQRFYGLTILALPGYYLPFRDIPVRTDVTAATVQAMVGALTSAAIGMGIRIGPIANDSPVRHALLDALRDARWSVLEIPRGELLNLELPAERKEYKATVRGRAKKADYFLRRMKKDVDVAIELHHDLDAPMSPTPLAQLQSIESRSWVAESGSPRFIGDRNERFWRHLCARRAFVSSLRTWILSGDGTPSSFCTTMDAGPVRYQLVNGYADEVRRYSTGHIVFQDMIHDAIDAGLTRINFGQGDPGHKSEWGARPTQNLTDLVALKPGILGAIAVRGYQALSRFKARRRSD